MSIFSDVQLFMITGKVKYHTTPTWDSDLAHLAIRLIAEEKDELFDAIFNEDLQQIAKESIDLIYVITELINMLGIDGKLIWDEVQKSNMAKFPKGEVTKRKDGKILKPEGWEKPDIASCFKLMKKRQKKRKSLFDSPTNMGNRVLILSPPQVKKVKEVEKAVAHEYAQERKI